MEVGAEAIPRTLGHEPASDSHGLNTNKSGAKPDERLAIESGISVRLESVLVNEQVASAVSGSGEIPAWTFLTNHGHVLVCIAQDPEVRLAEMARLVGISERAVHRIVHDLIDGGFVTSSRIGRRNVYELRLDRHLRHPLEAQHRLRDVFGSLAQGK